ncbi:hypothetical protein [Nonomuraea sp. NPDC049400]|uniref:hypothetical protein n=1 Tax=Nonomuraea sp. NPDC049400 TaxID=3364352 RepID=UPI003796E367
MPFPIRVRVLAKVDGSTLAGGVRGNLGHDVKAWTGEPLEGDQHFIRRLLAGVKSVLDMAPFCR